MNRWKLISLSALLSFTALSFGQAGYGPFDPAKTPPKYSPDRTFDLLDVKVALDVDYPNRSFYGKSTNVLTYLRTGLSEIMMHAGPGVEIKTLTVDGKPAIYRRVGRELFIRVPSTVRGKQSTVVTTYTGGKGGGRNMMGDGFHWHTPTKALPDKVGFWTQGETMTNSDWVVTWDYPNDFTTTAVTVTVPAAWTAISNGLLQTTTVSSDKKNKTFAWKQDQPHATYLMSIVAMPMDVKYDKWRDVQLIYTVPKGKGNLIDDSFGDTKDMLEFYSNRLGVKYAWRKYAQNATFDFPGGMENVSSTTLGEFGLTDKREGFRNMASLNSHELGHQWFGDLVSCKNWGDAWLNESFATYMEYMYFEHSRGKNAYDEEINGGIQAYLGESRRYTRPISTKHYPDQEMMFDSHTYPKGGVVMHMLRKWIGDEAFFKGLNRYLTLNRHQPVESANLRQAMTDAGGINVDAFWSQWIEKPGHPILDYSWSYADGKITLKVNQTQNTATGIPIYRIPTKVGYITAGGMIKVPVTLDGASQTIEISAQKEPTAVILDPDHDLLKEVKFTWKREELFPIVMNAPCSVDKNEALRRLLRDNPTDTEVMAIAEMIQRDRQMFPAIRSISGLVSLEKPALRSFFTAMASHQNITIQGEAISGLGRLPKDDAAVKLMRSRITATAGISVVVNAIRALADWDAKGNKDIFTMAAKIPSRGDRIKRAAESALESIK